MADSLSSLKVSVYPKSNNSNTTYLTSDRAEFVMINDNLHNNSMSYGMVGNTTLSPLVNTTSDMNVTGSDDFENQWSFEFSVIMATILSISSFVTIVGNAMVLTVMYRHRGMRTRTNLFLVNLAVADFLVGLTVMPFSITTLIEGRWIFGEGLICSLNGWLNALCLITSIHTLMYIGVNKYFSILRPLNNPIKLAHIVAMMLMAWIWAAICATLAVSGHSVEYKEGTSQCGPKYPTDNMGYWFHGIIQVTVIVIPFIILLFCYIQMFREIKRHSERLRNNTTVEEDFIITQQKKVAVTLFIVLATFVIMALPYHLYASYTTAEPDKQNFPSYINPIAYCFLYLNSMCNPIIYAFRSPAFREGYKEILCQTPNYVIRDGAGSAQTRRFCSIFSLRSRRAISQTSGGDVDIANPLSPLPLLSPQAQGCRPNAKFKKRKSLPKMIRSSRRSSTPSVIHRDGEVIIIKGGKIVSVRRESESVASPNRLIQAPFSNSVAHAVISGLILDTSKGDEEDKMRENNLSATHRKDNGLTSHFMDTTADRDIKRDYEAAVKSETSKSVSFGELNLNKDSDSVFICNTDVDNPGENGVMFDNSNEYKQFSSIEELSFSFTSRSAQHSKHEQLTDRRNVPNLTIELHPTENSSTRLPPPPQHSYLPLPTLSNMVVGIASNTPNILLGMPLSPHTRNVLAKSDMQLNDNSSSYPLHHRLLTSSITHAQSSENLSRRPMRRLPSLEYLDPPVHYFRSHVP